VTRAERKEHRELRAFINRTAKEVAKWPVWMKGKPDPRDKRKP
jgi:hypothetical protein